MIAKLLAFGLRIGLMAVVKVRASAQSDELREYSIDAYGIHVGDSLPDQEGLLVGPAEEARQAVFREGRELRLSS